MGCEQPRRTSLWCPQKKGKSPQQVGKKPTTRGAVTSGGGPRRGPAEKTNRGLLRCILAVLEKETKCSTFRFQDGPWGMNPDPYSAAALTRCAPLVSTNSTRKNATLSAGELLRTEGHSIRFIVLQTSRLRKSSVVPSHEGTPGKKPGFFPLR